MGALMEETLLYWTLNGEPGAPFLCSAGDAREMLLGHLIAGGLSPVPGTVHMQEDENRVWQVQARLESTAGGFMPQRLQALSPLASGLVREVDQIRACLDQVMALDHGTGLHAVLLWDGQKTALGRDIGRHNAVEKAVGSAALAGLRLDEAVMCTSGRLSLEMLAKAAFAGIPIVATGKQAGSLCVHWAAEKNIAVCRLGREERCYGAAWRVRGLPEGEE